MDDVVPHPAIFARHTDRVPLLALLVWTVVTAPLVILPFTEELHLIRSSRLGAWAVMLASTAGLVTAVLRRARGARTMGGGFGWTLGGGFLGGWVNSVLCGAICFAPKARSSWELATFLFAAGILGLVLGGGAGLAFGTAFLPLVPALRSGTTRLGPGGHDRIMSTTGVWLFVASTLTAAAAQWADVLAVAMAAAGLAAGGLFLAVVAFANAASRRRWIERVRSGMVPGWQIEDELRWSHELDRLDPLIPGRCVTSVLVRVPRSLEYRANAGTKAVALIPTPLQRSRSS